MSDRPLRVLAAAIAVSAIGDWVAVIALGFKANDMWKGGVALLLICLWAPSVALAGHVGLLVDRLETRTLAVVAGVFQAAIAAALAFVQSFGGILVLAIVLGTGVAVATAAEFALVPLLAGTRGVARANGLTESMRGIGFVAGPAIGGLVSTTGTKWAMLADAASFLVIAAVIAALPVRRKIVQRDGAKPRARDGVRLLFIDKVMGVTIAMGAVSLVFMSASIPGDFAYAHDSLHVGRFAFGIVLTLWAVGMIVAAQTIPQRVPLAAIGGVTLSAAALQGLAKFVAPFWQLYAVMAVCWVIGGVGHGVKNAGFRTLIHHHVPPDSHGRAFAAFNGMRNGAELAALAFGALLVNTLGGRGTLWIAGGIAAAASIVGLFVLGARTDQPAAAAKAS